MKLMSQLKAHKNIHADGQGSQMKCCGGGRGGGKPCNGLVSHPGREGSNNPCHLMLWKAQPAVQASYQGKLTIRSMQLFIQPAMFEFELQLTMEEEGWERQKQNIHSPTPPHSLFFTIAYPLGTNFFPSPSAAIKIKDGSHNSSLRKYYALACQNFACSAGCGNQDKFWHHWPR